MPERARPDPQGEFWETGPPADDFCQAPAPDDLDQRLADPDFH